MKANTFSSLHRASRAALVVGIFAIALTIFGAIGAMGIAFQSYVAAYVFWLDLSLGSLTISLIHCLTGGAWGLVVRRPLEAATRALPLMAVLFLPLIAGVYAIYPWTHPGSALNPELLHAKAWYLNVPFFFSRAALYFVCWLSLAYLFRRWTDAARRSGGDPTFTAKLTRLSVIGLILCALTVTLAAVDWVESLEPRFYSAVFGLAYGVGQLLAALAFAIVCASLYARNPSFARVATSDRFHDLGNLQLMLVLLWGYLALSQYVTVWVADLPHEIVWYVPRTQTSWRWAGLALVLLHFVVPFGALLLRGVKRRRERLAAVASILLVGQIVNAFWLVAPAVRTAGFTLYWTDGSALIGIGGLWLAVVLRALASSPIPPPAQPSSAPRAVRHDRSTSHATAAPTR